MKKILFLIAIALAIIGCSCKPDIVVQKEYVECEKVNIPDLNYTNNTDYTDINISYEVIDEAN